MQKILPWEKNSLSKSLQIIFCRQAPNSSDEEPPDKKPRKGESVDTLYSQKRTVLDNWDTEDVSTVPDNDDSVTQLTSDSNKVSPQCQDQTTARYFLNFFFFH